LHVEQQQRRVCEHQAKRGSYWQGVLRVAFYVYPAREEHAVEPQINPCGHRDQHRRADYENCRGEYVTDQSAPRARFARLQQEKGNAGRKEA